MKPRSNTNNYKKSNFKSNTKSSKSNHKDNKIIISQSSPLRPGCLRINPMPQAIEVNCDWNYIGSAMSTVSDDFNFLRFKLNSVIDPGLSLSTNNAVAWLGYLTMYGAFAVVESSIKVQVVNTDNDVPFRLTVLPDLDDPTRTPTWTSDAPLVAAPNSVSLMVGNATGEDKLVISRTCDIGKLAGVGRINASKYEYTGLTGADSVGVADPAATGCWVVSA